MAQLSDTLILIMPKEPPLDLSNPNPKFNHYFLKSVEKLTRYKMVKLFDCFNVETYAPDLITLLFGTPKYSWLDNWPWVVADGSNSTTKDPERIFCYLPNKKEEC